MGFFAWIRERFGAVDAQEQAFSSESPVHGAAAATVGATAADEASWVDVVPFVDVEDAQDRTLVSVIASAVAAGDRQDSKLVVRRVGRENPEHRRVAVISAAIAAADRPSSSFRCVRIRRRMAAKSA